MAIDDSTLKAHRFTTGSLADTKKVADWIHNMEQTATIKRDRTSLQPEFVQWSVAYPVEKLPLPHGELAGLA